MFLSGFSYLDELNMGRGTPKSITDYSMQFTPHKVKLTLYIFKQGTQNYIIMQHDSVIKSNPNQKATDTMNWGLSEPL